jgi:hypothetical protein
MQREGIARTEAEGKYKSRPQTAANGKFAMPNPA